MSSDLDQLIAPIAADKPTGVSLRYDSTYQHIAEARREDDATLPQGNWERPLKRADWIQVDQLCTEALTNQSKDLQIAAWLAEAWLYLNGLDGLTRGLGLIESLCRNYWDAIHPQIEDGDIDYRVAPFVWINDNLALALRRAVPIVEDVSQISEAKLSLADWGKAVHLENVARKDANAAKLAEQAKAPTRAIFKTSASLTSPAFFSGLYERIARCDAAVGTLEQLMLEKLRDDSPGLAHLRDSLEEMRNAVRELGGERAIAPAPEKTRAPMSGDGAGTSDSAAQAAAEGNEMAQSESKSGESAGPSGASRITSREEAFRRLDEAADYLMRTEPHSPCPYLVKRAVAWGNMPLAQLLQELVRGEGDLQELYGLLGMHQEQPGEPK
jgi:type VI secretion system protein ImpA